jgi:hypothetical protein
MDSCMLRAALQQANSFWPGDAPTDGSRGGSRAVRWPRFQCFCSARTQLAKLLACAQQRTAILCGIRTRALCLGVDRLADAHLADDFRTVRQAVFPGDKRRFMDMRRSGTLEAIAGGAEGFGLAAQIAKSRFAAEKAMREEDPELAAETALQGLPKKDENRPFVESNWTALIETEAKRPGLRIIRGAYKFGSDIEWDPTGATLATTN